MRPPIETNLSANRTAAMRFAFLVILLVIFSPVSGNAQRSLPAGDVPPEFQAAYAELDSILEKVDGYLDSRWDLPTSRHQELSLAASTIATIPALIAGGRSSHEPITL